MAKAFNRDQLLEAFDEIGRTALAAGVKLHVAVYGGSALILASNFRFTTEDVDIARLARPWPDWLAETIEQIAKRNRWTSNWFNDAVTFHLSPLADEASDHVEFGTFPRDLDSSGLVIYVPTAEYLLALKLKAIRVNDPDKGEPERGDILNLMRLLGIDRAEDAIAVLARYFPVSGADADKQRFLLKYVLELGGAVDAPEYPRRGD